jgi:hypothetical protein
MNEWLYYLDSTDNWSEYELFIVVGIVIGGKRVKYLVTSEKTDIIVISAAYYSVVLSFGHMNQSILPGQPRIVLTMELRGEFCMPFLDWNLYKSMHSYLPVSFSLSSLTAMFQWPKQEHCWEESQLIPNLQRKPCCKREQWTLIDLGHYSLKLFIIMT